jgi:hypothetical protein
MWNTSGVGARRRTGRRDRPGIPNHPPHLIDATGAGTTHRAQERDARGRGLGDVAFVDHAQATQGEVGGVVGDGLRLGDE